MDAALQLLLEQGRIQLYEPDNGKLVDERQFFMKRGR